MTLHSALARWIVTVSRRRPASRRSTGQLREAPAKIAALEPVRYALKSDPERRVRLGLIAQDVETVYPKVVTGQGETMKAADYAALVSPLIAAIKELKAANDNLTARIEILEGRSVAASPATAVTPGSAPARAKEHNP